MVVKLYWIELNWIDASSFTGIQHTGLGLLAFHTSCIVVKVYMYSESCYQKFKTIELETWNLDTDQYPLDFRLWSQILMHT